VAVVVGPFVSTDVSIRRIADGKQPLV
jgi:hypothetical protein